MPRRKKQEPTWEDIGKSIGKKMEKLKFDECGPWKNRLNVRFEEHGGGFGRFVFAAGIAYLLHLKGMLVGIPTWLIVLLVIGFAMMNL